jgi:hypothetical protein
MSGERIISEPKTAREFFDGVMKDAESNAAFTALNFSHDLGRAYNFYMGYTEWLGEQEDMQGRDQYRVAESNITHVTGYCISGVEKDGKSPTEQFTEALGVWPKVFDAAQVQLEGRAVLEQVD